MSIHELPDSPAVRRAYNRLIKVVGEALDGTEDEKKKMGVLLFLRKPGGNWLFPNPGMLVPRPNGPLKPSDPTSPTS